MKRIIIYCILSLFLLQSTVSQTVLLHEKISDYDFEMPKQGPNFRHFTHLYLGFAFYIPTGNKNEIPIINGLSTAFSVGVRYKFKLTNFFAIGTALNYTNDIFTIKQDKTKIFPNSNIHKREKLRLNSLGSEAFIRFNFGKRGNIIGRFIDFGAYINWVFVAKLVFKDQIKNQPNSYNAKKIKVVLSNLNYIKRYHYGVKTRIGMNRFVINASYRLDELLNDEYKPLFLPRFNVGIEIGLHK